MRKLIYLREANEYVGPFASRGEAELFLGAMVLSGENLEGIEIVEIDNISGSPPKAVSIVERRRLLEKAKRSRRSKRSR